MRCKMIDLHGQKFHRLTVLSVYGKDRWGQYVWQCKCNCGTEVLVRSRDLRNGAHKSCGCLQSENRITHHLSKTKTYQAWVNMKQRCYNPKTQGYKLWGGRGITVCERWLNSFENFLEDMGEAPPKHSLDRIDNDDNYYAANCRWANKLEQDNNRSTCVYLEYNGETLTISQIARRLNVCSETIRGRIKRGWTIEQIFTKPKQ